MFNKIMVPSFSFDTNYEAPKEYADEYEAAMDALASLGQPKEANPWRMDIRQILAAIAIKDLMAEEDKLILDALKATYTNE